MIPIRKSEPQATEQLINPIAKQISVLIFNFRKAVGKYHDRHAPGRKSKFVRGGDDLNQSKQQGNRKRDFQIYRCADSPTAAAASICDCQAKQELWAGFDGSNRILAHCLPVDAQFAGDPPARPTTSGQCPNRMLQAHIENVHHVHLRPPPHPTQQSPQKWLVFIRPLLAGFDCPLTALVTQ
jgi:hypothetical protein